MANYLITGYWGEPHVTAENDRGLNAAIFGPGRFLLPVGEQFRAEYIGNNTVRIHNGKLLDNGAFAGIPAGLYVDLLIPEAGQGMNRNDLIVFQYTKDPGTLVETGTFVVVSGEETAGAAADPALTQQDILTDEATMDQMALFRVSVSGTVISAPVLLADVRRGLAATSYEVLNLLDNSDFTNPVNTNGKTAYRGLGFSIDRWVVPNDKSALTVGSGFVLVQNDDTAATSMFVNRLRSGTIKTGKTYTGIIYLNDGTVYFGSGYYNGGDLVLTSTGNDVYLQIAIGTTYDLFRICIKPGKFARVNFVALYEGKYKEGNMPTYTRKGYGVESANCFIAGGGSFAANYAPASVE